MIMDTQEIMAEANRRSANDRDRMQMYVRCANEYFGHFGGQGVQAMNTDGRPVDRVSDLRASLRGRAGAPNLLMPMVDDFVSLKGQIPVMSVLPESDTQEAKDRAHLRSRILRAMWQNSHMTIQQPQSAWYLSTLGDTVYILEPLFPPKNPKDIDRDPIFEGGLKPPGVYITVVDPSMAYPNFRTGADREELEDLIVAWVTDGRVARNRWGVDVDPESDVQVLQFYSRTQKSTIVGMDRVEHTEHNLGFCPAQWMKNKPTGQHGQSDIASVLDVHEEFQIMARVSNDSLIQATYPLTWIKNVESFPDKLPTGPGAVIPITGDGAIGQLAPTAAPQAAQALMQTQRQHMEQMAGSSPVRTQASIDHSNISARTVHAVQGPMESRLESFQDVLGYHITSLNAKILLMLYKLPDFKNGPMTAYSVDKQTSVMGTTTKQTIDTFTPDDLDGWWRTDVEWESQSDRHENVVVGLQLLGNGIVPRTYVAQQAGIVDPELSIAQADAEKQMQAQMQAQAAPPGGPGEPGAEPGGVQAAAMQPADQAVAMMGGSGGGQPMPSPGTPPPGEAPPGGGVPPFPPMDMPPTAPGIGTPAAMQDPNEMIAQLLEPILPQLQGSIVAISPTPGGVSVTITDWKDSNRVRRALSPMGKVQLKVDPTAKATAAGPAGPVGAGV